MAAPAEPILASSLWHSHQAARNVYDTRHQHVHARKRRKLLSGYQCVDEAFGEGLAYGEGGVCCISAEDGAGGNELSRHLLVSHLLSHASSTATIIDTNGLDLRALLNIIKLRLARQPYTNPNLPVRDIDAEAMALLNRVRISRAFDFEGLLECISEMRESLENSQDRQQSLRRDESMDVSAETRREDVARGEKDKPDAPRETVADSQAGGEEDDEMLVEPTPPLADDPNSAAQDVADEDTGPDQPTRVEVSAARRPHPSLIARERSEPPPALLFVSDLSTPLSFLRRSTSYAQFHSLLSSLFRTLRHLTSSYHLCTIILNSAAQPQSYARSNAARDSTRGQGGDTRQSKEDQRHALNSSSPNRGTREIRKEESPSIFSSSKIIPSNHQAVSEGVDLHLLLQRIPKTVDDARSYYSGGTDQGRDGRGGQDGSGVSAAVGVGIGGHTERRERRGAARGMHFASVLEVLVDRYGDRVGSFGAFEIDGEGGIESVDAR